VTIESNSNNTLTQSEVLINGESRILWQLLVPIFLVDGYGPNMNDPGTLFFVLMAGLAGTMTLVYFPLRLFLTATARSRRLKLLQKIRKLRNELEQPINS